MTLSEFCSATPIPKHHRTSARRHRRKSRWSACSCNPLFFAICPTNDRHDLAVPRNDLRIVVPVMREYTFLANLIALFIVSAISAALSAQRIQRAVAEQAVELFCVNPLVAGEILAFSVLEKLMMQIFLRHSLSHLPQGTSSPRTILYTDSMSIFWRTMLASRSNSRSRNC